MDWYFCKIKEIYCGLSVQSHCIRMSACCRTVLLCFGFFRLFPLSWDDFRITILMLSVCLCSHVNGSGLFSYRLKENWKLDSGLTCPTCCSVGEDSCSTQKSTIVLKRLWLLSHSLNPLTLLQHHNKYSLSVALQSQISADSQY